MKNFNNKVVVITGAGAVVNVSSIFGLVGTPGNSDSLQNR